MDFSKMTTNNWIAGGAGAVSLVNIFFPWYGAFGFNINAFDAGFAAWFGALLAVAAGVIVVLKALDVFDAKVGGLEAEQLAMVVGVLGFLFILLRLITESSITKFGIYLGLIAAAGAAVGAFLSGKDAGIGIPSADDFKGDGGDGGGSSTF